jgi:hypothetical protein
MIYQESEIVNLFGLHQFIIFIQKFAFRPFTIKGTDLASQLHGRE